jgi:hypothetical protein
MLRHCSSSQVEAATIRTAFEQSGKLATVVELRRLFPLIANTMQARECARTIAGWKSLPTPLRPVEAGSPESGPAITADPRERTVTKTLVHRVGVVNASSSFEHRDAVIEQDVARARLLAARCSKHRLSPRAAYVQGSGLVTQSRMATIDTVAT